MCHKSVDDYSIALEFIPDRYKTQEMCDRIISDDPFSLGYAPDKICDEAVTDFIRTLGFVSYWFVTSKIIIKLFTALYADENILNFDYVINWVLFIKILILLILIIDWCLSEDKKFEIDPILLNRHKRVGQ